MREARSPPRGAWLRLRFLVVAVSCDWLPAMEAGTWAEWSTATVALLALMAAFWAGRAAWAQNKATLDLLEVERQREDRAAELEQRRTDVEERSHQADAVAVWIRWATDRRARLVAEVQNQSLLPIYEARVTFVLPDGERLTVGSNDGAIVPPGSESIVIPERLVDMISYDRTNDALPPGKRYRARELSATLRASITFRDTAGRSWLRDEDGYLHRRKDQAE